MVYTMTFQLTSLLHIIYTLRDCLSHKIRNVANRGNKYVANGFSYDVVLCLNIPKINCFTIIFF